MSKYWGFGKENTFNNKYCISLFFGKKYVTIVFYTKKYKFIPRIYKYDEESFSYMQTIGMFNLSWFFGFVF